MKEAHVGLVSSKTTPGNASYALFAPRLKAVEPQGLRSQPGTLAGVLTLNGPL